MLEYWISMKSIEKHPSTILMSFERLLKTPEKEASTLKEDIGIGIDFEYFKKEVKLDRVTPSKKLLEMREEVAKGAGLK